MHHVFFFNAGQHARQKTIFFLKKNLFSMSKPNVEIGQFIDIETFDSDSDSGSEKRLTLTVTLSMSKNYSNVDYI
jgi:hypothetical protein